MVASDGSTDRNRDPQQRLAHIASVVSHHQRELRALDERHSHSSSVAGQLRVGEEPGMDYVEFVRRRRYTQRPFWGFGGRSRCGWVLVLLVMGIIGHNWATYSLYNVMRWDTYPATYDNLAPHSSVYVVMRACCDVCLLWCMCWYTCF